MGYQVGRVYLHAVSTWSLSLGCCGYIFRAVFFSVSWDFVFFFVFVTWNTHGLLKVRRNLASCTSLLLIAYFEVDG